MHLGGISTSISAVPLVRGSLGFHSDETEWSARVERLTVLRARLSEAAPANPVLAEHPDLYLFGALAEAAPFLRDGEMLAVFAARFDAALTEARMREARIAAPAPPRVDPALLALLDRRQ